MIAKSVAYLMVAVLVLVGGAPFVAAQSSSGPVEHFGSNAWTNWDAGVIKAQGFGVPPRGVDSAAQATVMARRAAVVDAYRGLLEASLNVAVRSKTAVEQAGVKWDTIETQVQGIVRNAEILEEQEYPDGRYEVVMQMPLYGPTGLGHAVIPHVVSPAVAPMAPMTPMTPVPPRRPGYNPTAIPPAPTDAYTGLVILVEGVRLDRSMSPAVLTPEGDIVYGRGWWKPGQFDPDLANNVGIVGYASGTGTDSRAGAHPLVVHAIGVSGPPLSTFKTDVVVSDEDAARIRDANAHGHFLEQLHVDIVVQP